MVEKSTPIEDDEKENKKAHELTIVD